MYSPIVRINAKMLFVIHYNGILTRELMLNLARRSSIAHWTKFHLVASLWA